MHRPGISQLRLIPWHVRVDRFWMWLADFVPKQVCQKIVIKLACAVEWRYPPGDVTASEMLEYLDNGRVRPCPPIPTVGEAAYKRAVTIEHES